MSRIACFIVIALSLVDPCAVYSDKMEGSSSYGALFEEICDCVESNFYNPAFIQEEFPRIRTDYRKKMERISTPPEFSTTVGDMLAQLHASHTYYLSPHEYEYYQLAAIFSFLPAIQNLFHHEEITYPTVGIITETMEDRTFIVSVLPGGAAEKAGLLGGDEIVSANGQVYQPIDSLKDHVGESVEFEVRRCAGGPTQVYSVIPVRLNPKQEMLKAEEASVRVVEKDGKKIGYIHIYSYAGAEYHDLLISEIASGRLKDADALIIDLRYGLGGADPVYLNMFNPHVPVLASTDRAGNTYSYDPQWRKPAVYLVNKTSRSGKEILAFGAKKYRLATVIGERTAGAVLGGSLFPLSNGDLLYLAGRSSLVDHEKLEGVGVAPDIEVPMDIRYSEGRDAQIDRAVEYLLEAVGSRP